MQYKLFHISSKILAQAAPNCHKFILMLDPDEIKQYLAIFKEFNLTDLKDLFHMARIVDIKRESIYIAPSSTTKKMGYIRKGLIRAYHTKKNGDEITTILRWEKQFFASYDSIIRKRPSRLTYQALEDTVLLELDYGKAKEIIDKNPRLAHYRNDLLLEMLAEALARSEMLVLFSPSERYLQLIREKPDIINRVSNKHIATFLGITPVSLSRIRKRIASAGKRI